MLNLSEDEIGQITSALKHYHKQDFVLITDYKKVIENREEIIVNNETIYKYPCPCQTIYLDNENYAVNYERQHIITDEEGIEQYYYDFTPDNLPYEVAGTYEYIGTQEWKRLTNIWE